MAKVSKTQVNRAAKKAEAARLDGLIRGKKAKELTESDPVKLAKLVSERTQLQFQRGKLRLRKKNGN